jgi:hypothetical protein
VAAAFVVGRLTAPSPRGRNAALAPARPAGESSPDPPRSPATAAARPRTPRPGAAALDGPPSLPFALEEGPPSADPHLQAGTLTAGADPQAGGPGLAVDGHAAAAAVGAKGRPQAGPVVAVPDLAEPTCTTSGDVVRVEPDRLVILPCGLRQPREAICVAGTCRQVADGVDDVPETACARDGSALALDRDQKVYRPASPPSFTCPAAWYGVPAADDPLITLPDAPARTTATLKQNIRAWAQHIRSNPRSKYTIVAYTPAAPHPKEGCARAATRLRASAAKFLDVLVAEQPSVKPQLIRPAAIRTCSPPPSLSATPPPSSAAAPPSPSAAVPPPHSAATPSSGAATPRSRESAASAPTGARPAIAATQTAATHLLLVRGSVTSCTCIDPEPPPPPKPTPRPPARPRRP